MKPVSRQLRMLSDGSGAEIISPDSPDGSSCARLSFAGLELGGGLQNVDIKEPPFYRFSDDGATLVTIHLYRATVIWNATTGAKIAELDVHGWSDEARFFGDSVIVDGEASCGPCDIPFEARFDSSNGRLLSCDCRRCQRDGAVPAAINPPS